jgi:hypothetical protein
LICNARLDAGPVYTMRAGFNARVDAGPVYTVYGTNGGGTVNCWTISLDTVTHWTVTHGTVIPVTISDEPSVAHARMPFAKQAPS